MNEVERPPSAKTTTEQRGCGSFSITSLTALDAGVSASAFSGIIVSSANNCEYAQCSHGSLMCLRRDCDNASLHDSVALRVSGESGEARSIPLFGHNILSIEYMLWQPWVEDARHGRERWKAYQRGDADVRQPQVLAEPSPAAPTTLPLSAFLYLNRSLKTQETVLWK